MLALYFNGTRLTPQLNYPEPSPRPGEAVLKVLLAGICKTDLEIMHGYMGFAGVLGHEFVGQVVRCHSRPELVGKRVVGEINCGCGHCKLCKAGIQEHCPRRTVLGILQRDGAFAEYVTLPAKNLHVVPDSVPNQRAVFVEPVAAAFEVLAQRPDLPGKRVIVLGDGKLGLITAQVLASAGCAVMCVGRHRRKLDVLARRGIPVRLDSTSTPHTAPVVVDCTGSPSGFLLARRLVEPRGLIIMKTTVAASNVVQIAPLVIDEITVMGSRCGPFTPALRSIEEGAIDVDSVVSATYSLSDALSAFERAASPRVIKILLQPE
jgi:threonine dehydrogenase-like Zn-dependent dehydrogenase